MKAQFITSKLSTSTRSAVAIALTAALLLPLVPVTAIASSGLATTTPQVALAQPADEPVAFPRLAMWWPAPWSQPLEDIARYDWVGLNVEEAHYVSPLKDIEPSMQLFVTTNACEMGFSGMADLSAQWLLTQVGSQLTAAVGRTDSTIPVAKTNDRFEVGDYVVIEEEIVRVTGVSSNAINVQRGVAPTTARAHAAGVRAAAAIQFWEDSLVFDVTDGCPTVDVGHGPETWIDANVRDAAEQMATADWDGLIIDRSDATQSWLIDGGWARSIDYDRSNAFPADYTTFDAAWNSGMEALMQGYRDELGDVALLPNGEMAYFDTVNGSLFENYPTNSIGQWGKANWELSTFGTTGAGSLSEWEALGTGHNVSTVECYEDETDGSMTMPSPPNYQKVRFGLTTALVSGSYFSYEISTWAHGVGGLEWFDEYDNAGEGKGYLGQPIGEATPASAGGSSADLLSGDGSFDDAGEYDAWALNSYSGYAASKSLDGGKARIDVTNSAGGEGVEFFHNVAIPEAGQYTLSFRAKASTNMNVKSWACEDSDPWTSWFWTDSVGVTTEWQTFEIPVSAQGADPSAEFYLVTGNTTGSLWLDDIELLSGSDSTAYRRDFEEGIAIVNPSTESVTVDLAGSFRKIDGTQDRSVNDGSVVTQITVPGRDGIVLLRETPADDPPADDPPADDPPADDPPADDPPADDPPADDPPADGIGCGPDGIDYDCISGPDRYATAVEISREAFPNGTDTVVIATGQNWPDALGGGALAGTYDAPILLTETQTLPDIVAAEIRRLGATQAIILGGKFVVQPTVEWGLREAGITSITRYGGMDRYKTAELIAEATIERLGDDWDGTALVATGKNFPDALAGSPLASAAGWPLYLAEPGANANGLASRMRADGVTRAILLGGAGSVESAIEMALRDRGVTILRLAGVDRYETAAAIAEFSVEHGGLDWSAPAVSTGENFPDALAGGMLCAKKDSVLVLTGSSSVPAASAGVLSENRMDIEELVYLGGPGAVSEGVRSQIADVLQ